MFCSRNEMRLFLLQELHQDLHLISGDRFYYQNYMLFLDQVDLGFLRSVLPIVFLGSAAVTNTFLFLSGLGTFEDVFFLVRYSLILYKVFASVLLAASTASSSFFSSDLILSALQLLFTCLFRSEYLFLVSSFSDSVSACCVLYFAHFLFSIIFQVLSLIQPFCEPLLLPIHFSATSVTTCLKVLHCSSTFDLRSYKNWNQLCRFILICQQHLHFLVSQLQWFFLKKFFLFS